MGNYIQAAKQRRVLTSTQAGALFADLARGMPKVEAAKKYNISRRTLYRMLNREDKVLVYKPCGTNGAYMRHLRNKEAPCILCLRAHAEENQKWRKKRSGRRNASVVKNLS